MADDPTTTTATVTAPAAPAAPVKADPDEPPKKERDRQRPFLKVKPKPADEDIDGSGAPRGCFHLAGLGDLDQNVRLMTQENTGLLGDLLDAFEKARQAVKDLKQFLKDSIVVDILTLGRITALLDMIEGVVDLIEKRIIGRFAKRLLPRACRVMPHWVPVKRDFAAANSPVIKSDEVVEVQGLITRSYQSPLDVPFFQWRHWYGWTVEVKPDPGFEKVLSPASNPPTDAKNLNNPPTDGETVAGTTPLQADGTVECQWDCGALFQSQALYEAGILGQVKDRLANRGIERATGPMVVNDWAWPQTGQFFWAAGRWVYDCSRSTTSDGFGKHAAMLHPCKAIATASLAGDKFPENEFAVPVTKFMFFTSKHGGYLDYEAINDQDYEFIVDLPELAEEDRAPFNIGRTEKFNDEDDDTLKDNHDFLHNTLVLRPRLLVKFNTTVFRDAGGAQANPTVELIKPEKGNVPTHVRITIPKSIIGDAPAYGVIVTLGWLDSDGSQAAKVRQCTVRLKRIEPNAGRIPRDKPDEIKRLFKDVEAEIADEARKEVREKIRQVLGKDIANITDATLGNAIDFFINKVVGTFVGAVSDFLVGLFAVEEDWLLHIGVNGRWFANRIDFRAEKKGLTGETTFFLLDKEPIRISIAGTDLDPVGKVMLTPKKDRLLDLPTLPDGKANNKPVDWPFIVSADNDGAKALEIRKKLVRRYVFRLLSTLADDNDPTGWGDDKKLGLGDGSHPDNQLQVDFADALDDFRTYVQKLGTPDHILFYDIDLKKQDAAKPA